MRAKHLCRDQDFGSENLAKRYKRNGEGDGSNGWRYTEVAQLTNLAGRFLVVIRVRVRKYLDQKEKREQRKRKRQGFEESARERMRDRRHFSCLLGMNTSMLAPFLARTGRL
jgi:hypothetical protein